MYLWFRTWNDQQGRLWADRDRSGDPMDAKQRHAADLRFGWTDDKLRPAVTGLMFTNEHGHTIEVRPGAVRDLPQHHER